MTEESEELKQESKLITKKKKKNENSLFIQKKTQKITRIQNTLIVLYSSKKEVSEECQNYINKIMEDKEYTVEKEVSDEEKNRKSISKYFKRIYS